MNQSFWGLRACALRRGHLGPLFRGRHHTGSRYLALEIMLSMKILLRSTYFLSFLAPLATWHSVRLGLSVALSPREQGGHEHETVRPPLTSSLTSSLTSPLTSGGRPLRSPL